MQTSTYLNRCWCLLRFSNIFKSDVFVLLITLVKLEIWIQSVCKLWLWLRCMRWTWLSSRFHCECTCLYNLGYRGNIDFHYNYMYTRFENINWLFAFFNILYSSCNWIWEIAASYYLSYLLGMIHKLSSFLGDTAIKQILSKALISLSF